MDIMHAVAVLLLLEEKRSNEEFEKIEICSFKMGATMKMGVAV